jgi:transcriptional regulator with XRE-family HTH domain
MSLGYSLRLVELNESADECLLGVQLGRACIRNNVPVSAVAARLGVSRQTVYNWFAGGTTPRLNTSKKIETLLTSLQRQQHGKL